MPAGGPPLPFERKRAVRAEPRGREPSVRAGYRPAAAAAAAAADGTWQMSFGERAALEGILAQVRPRIAVEIGTAEGGSLARIAAHSAEVHSIDLNHDALRRSLPTHVTLHTGPSGELLASLLDALSASGRDVDLVLIDGDLETTLRSSATCRAVILVHDTMNAEVRAGIESVRPETWQKVVYYEPDLVAGYVFREGPVLNQAWGSLGLILTDRRRSDAYASPRQPLYYEPFDYSTSIQAARAVLRTAAPTPPGPEHA